MDSIFVEAIDPRTPYVRESRGAVKAGSAVKACGVVKACLLKRTVLAVSATLALSLPFVSAHAAWLPGLSPELKQTISEASLKRASQSDVSVLRSRTTAKVVHPLGVQVLFVEAKEEKKKTSDAGLLAEVFLFDYTQVQTSVELVRANSGELISKTNLDSLQLPLNAVEADYATSLLATNTNFFTAINDEYTQQFSNATLSNNDIDMKVSVWVPDARVHPNTPCLASRCALVSVFTPGHYNFSIEPVVDLVTGDIYLDLFE